VSGRLLTAVCDRISKGGIVMNRQTTGIASAIVLACGMGLGLAAMSGCEPADPPPPRTPPEQQPPPGDVPEQPDRPRQPTPPQNDDDPFGSP
jgi:hypothetical protein